MIFQNFMGLKKTKNEIIINLRKELNYEKEKTNKLAIELKLEQQKNFDLSNQLKTYKDMSNQLNIRIKSLQSELISKNKDLQNLIFEIKNYKEKLIITHFISKDENINYAIICKNNDNFIKLEEELFTVYPDYKNKNYNFYLD